MHNDSFEKKEPPSHVDAPQKKPEEALRVHSKDITEKVLGAPPENTKKHKNLSKERIIRDHDSFDREVKLRKSAMEKFNHAKEIAEANGYNLFVFSSYRSLEQQRRIWNKGLEKRRKEHPEWSEKKVIEVNKKWVSSPEGNPPHLTGGAVDVYAIPKDTTYTEYKKIYKNASGFPKQHREDLEKIMLQAGFVRYEAEFWHFEYGTPRWARKTGRSQRRIYSKL